VREAAVKPAKPKAEKAAPARMGRPLELDDATGGAIVASMREGNYLETAAALAGVTKWTVRNWIRRGAKEAKRRRAGEALDAEGALFADFFTSVEKARAEAEADDLAAIRSDGSWQARAWRLERRHPARWGRQTVEHQGTVTLNVKFDRKEA
jgi:hypothetical protein